MCNMKALPLQVSKLWPRLKFFKSMSNFKVKSSKFMVPCVKGLVTRNTHLQYESPTSSGLKVMAKVKVFVYAANADTNADTRAMT